MGGRVRVTFPKKKVKILRIVFERWDLVPTSTKSIGGFMPIPFGLIKNSDQRGVEIVGPKGAGSIVTKSRQIYQKRQILSINQLVMARVFGDGLVIYFCSKSSFI